MITICRVLKLPDAVQVAVDQQNQKASETVSVTNTEAPGSIETTYTETTSQID